MSDNKNPFQPEKLTMLNYTMVKGQVEVPENFDASLLDGNNVEHGLQLGFNVDEKLIRADYQIALTTESKGKATQEASGQFHLVFIYHVENFEALAHMQKDNLVTLHPALANAITAVTYSTARGILLVRLQGTPFQYFILPIIDPNSLLHPQSIV